MQMQERKGTLLPPCMASRLVRVAGWLAPAGPDAVDRVALLPMRRQVRPRRVKTTVVRARLSSDGHVMIACGGTSRAYTYVRIIADPGTQLAPAGALAYCVSVCRGAKLTRHCLWTTTDQSPSLSLSPRRPRSGIHEYSNSLVKRAVLKKWNRVAYGLVAWYWPKPLSPRLCSKKKGAKGRTTLSMDWATMWVESGRERPGPH